jgi:surface protein
MGYMLSEATRFKGDLSRWDVSQVIDMDYMFSGAIQFNGDLRQWDVSNVILHYGVFNGAYQFNGDLSPWEYHHINVEIRRERTMNLYEADDEEGITHHF